MTTITILVVLEIMEILEPQEIKLEGKIITKAVTEVDKDKGVQDQVAPERKMAEVKISTFMTIIVMIMVHGKGEEIDRIGIEEAIMARARAGTREDEIVEVNGVTISKTMIMKQYQTMEVNHKIIPGIKAVIKMVIGGMAINKVAKIRDKITAKMVQIGIKDKMVEVGIKDKMVQIGIKDKMVQIGIKDKMVQIGIKDKGGEIVKMEREDRMGIGKEEVVDKISLMRAIVSKILVEGPVTFRLVY
jgi:hypothetical protein